MIKLIVGLGNPGPRYAVTWHNLGRRAVQSLAERWGVAGRWTEWAGQARLVTAHDVFLAQPLVYMNESGPCVQALLAQCQGAASDLLVVSDDFSLPLGVLRMRRRGSAGGHRGLASVIGALGTEGFARLRLGIGPVPEGEDPAEFVLRTIPRDQRVAVDTLLASAAEALEALLMQGFEHSMSRFNQ